MTCREFVEFLADYLGGALPAVARAEFDTHLATCEPCRQYLHGYAAALKLAKSAHTDDPIPEDVPDELVKAILSARAKAK